MQSASAERTRHAERCWDRIREAMRAGDDRTLWIAWRAAFQHRFWRDLGCLTVGELFRDPNEYSALLARLTAYEMSRTRDRAADTVQLETAIRDSAPPPPLTAS